MGREWVIEVEEGWSGSAPPRTARAPRLSRPGDHRSPNYKGGRIVTLSGWVYCPTWEARRDAEHTLSALCGDPHRLYELRCTEELGDLYTLVELDAATEVEIRPGGHWLDFDIQLAAPDPRRWSVQTRSASARLFADGAGGVVYTPGVDFVPGVEYGAIGSTGRMVLRNDGYAESDIRFTLTGSTLVNPAIRNSSTSDLLWYRGDPILPGQVLTLDSATTDVRLNGANKRALLSRAQWFRIPPRSEIELRFSADQPDPTALLVAEWSDAY
ncbi:hypothetical protein EV193_104370 [Herbihabitans rhizosphaerae]|uniref:Tail protein n=2 Tax=Herbihabitans rhizosphaerae TaxID=1872711 RepID=A0A4Q7KRL1_9PSEU|nr:hypothetical protein EV193_104370 [Herbihabitans rhizosphaerae]